MRTPLLIIVAAGLSALAGCNDRTGFLIRPVTVERDLEETVLADPGGWTSEKIAIMDVDGVLANDRSAGVFGPKDNPVSLFREKLDKAQADPDVRAVILRVNSPGGSVTASDIMYASLRRFQAAKSVPVVAIFEDVAASGGYYVACAADEMIAHPTSVTGSIGVIIQTVSFAGTMKMIGIDARAITSGQYKDMGSPLKPLDQQHHELFQKMVNEFYERFVGVVDQGRPDLSTERVRELADGRVYTATQARQAGLVDRIGYMEDAVARAKELAGVGKAKLVMYHRPFGHRANVYSRTAPPAATEINLLKLDASSIPTQPHPRFLYLWTGRE